VATGGGQRRVAIKSTTKSEMFEQREVGCFVADGARQCLISHTKRIN